MVRAYATMRMPRHQARAVQMLVLTGCRASRSRIMLMMDVMGWLSAKARTGPGMVRVGTNAELMNGRKMSGEENAPAPSGGFADRPAMTAIQVNARVSKTMIPRMASHAGAPAPERNPMGRAMSTTITSEIRVETTEVSTCAHSTLERAIGRDWNRSKIPVCMSVKSRSAV